MKFSGFPPFLWYVLNVWPNLFVVCIIWYNLFYSHNALSVHFITFGFIPKEKFLHFILNQSECASICLIYWKYSTWEELLEIREYEECQWYNKICKLDCLTSPNWKYLLPFRDMLSFPRYLFILMWNTILCWMLRRNAIHFHEKKSFIV